MDLIPPIGEPRRMAFSGGVLPRDGKEDRMAALMDLIPPIGEPRRMAFSGGVLPRDGKEDRMADLVSVSVQMDSNLL